MRTPSVLAFDASEFDGRGAAEKRLCLAVLEDAIQCLTLSENGPKSMKLRQEATAWVQADCRDYLYAFIPLCEVLGLNPDALRPRLLDPTLARQVSLDRLSRIRRGRDHNIDAEQLRILIEEGQSFTRIARQLQVPVVVVRKAGGPILRELREKRNTEIKTRHARRESLASLELRFGLSKSQLIRICTGKG